MTHNKYILAGALCISALVQAASTSYGTVRLGSASDEESGSEHEVHNPVHSGMRISNWFDQDSIRVPDDWLIHRPVVAGMVKTVSKAERLLQFLNPLSLLGQTTGLHTTKIFYGTVGFISGPDQEGVEAMAAKWADIATTGITYEDTVNSQVVLSDPRLLTKIEGCQSMLIKMRRADNGHTFKRDEVQPSSAIGIVVPQRYAHLLRSLIALKKYERRAELLADLKQAANGLCEKELGANPDTKLIDVPILVQRDDISEFIQAIFSTDSH